MTQPSTIIAAIDFRQPQSHLAFGPTQDMATEIGLKIDWRPCSVPPMEPPTAPERDDDRGARHVRLRALYLERDLKRYADVQGIRLGDIYRRTNPDLAGMGLICVKRQAPAASVERYIEAVFTGFGGETLDIQNLDAIRGCLTEAGANADDFDPETLRGDLQYGEAQLTEAGVIGAPAYLVEDELFLGRQHLPMVRWLVTGKVGPAPI